MEAMNLDEGAFFAINKNNGEITLMMIDELTTINASKRVKELKKIVASKEMPELCHEDVPMGASRNKVLHNGCVFCNYKDICWKDSNDGEGLRVFHYSYGYKYFTKVVKEPNVDEVLNYNG